MCERLKIPVFRNASLNVEYSSIASYSSIIFFFFRNCLKFYSKSWSNENTVERRLSKLQLTELSNYRNTLYLAIFFNILHAKSKNIALISVSMGAVNKRIRAWALRTVPREQSIFLNTLCLFPLQLNCPLRDRFLGKDVYCTLDLL